MRRYFGILRAFLHYGARNDLAYIGHFWANLSSTMLYVITYVLFVELLFERVGTFGGISKDEFLFMTLVGQLTFYVWAMVQYAAMKQLVETVRTGAFDLLLLRPISLIFYVFTSAFRPIQALFVSVPNIIILCVVIDWSHVVLSPLSVVSGAVVWVCAMLVLATIMLVLVSPVFTQGDATDMVMLGYSLFSSMQLPFGQLPLILQQLSFIILPTLLAASGSTYVMLGKISPLPMVLGALAAGGVAVVCFNIIWKKALSNYSSASS